MIAKLYAVRPGTIPREPRRWFRWYATQETCDEAFVTLAQRYAELKQWRIAKIVHQRRTDVEVAA